MAGVGTGGRERNEVSRNPSSRLITGEPVLGTSSGVPKLVSAGPLGHPPVSPRTRVIRSSLWSRQKERLQEWRSIGTPADKHPLHPAHGAYALALIDGGHNLRMPLRPVSAFRARRQTCTDKIA